MTTRVVIDTDTGIDDAMGCAVYAPGNISPLAEFDAWGDKEAAQEVLQATWPVQMVSLDVTDVPILLCQP